MKIYISTSDNYHHCLKPFVFLFNKFWPEKAEVTILGYKIPEFELPENFTFFSMGTQKGHKYYSIDLKNFFESIDDKYFIYAMEDSFIIDKVKAKILETLKEEITLNSKIGRACLTNNLCQVEKNHRAFKGRNHTEYKKLENFKLIKLSETSSWRLTIGEWCIWNKEYMCKYLKENMTAGEFESQKAFNDGYDIIGTKDKFAIDMSEGVRRGKINENLDFRCVNNERKVLNTKIYKEMLENIKK